MTPTDKAKKVWQHWYIAKLGLARTIRSGSGLNGVYPFNPKTPFDDSRSESDLEHVAGICYLLWLISDSYPRFIKREELMSYLEAAIIHELGEIAGGDVADDGNRNGSVKDAEEMKCVESYLRGLSPSIGALEFFEEFQAKSTRRGQILYCADKTEAVLQSLVYESRGRVGTLDEKAMILGEDGISKRDIRYAKLTKSCKQVDIWSAHLLDTISKYSVSTIFIDIVCAAVIDVRGKWFDWAKNPPFNKP